VHGNASLFVSSLPRGSEVAHKFPDGMGGYLYVIDGELGLNGERLSTGDAAKISDHPEIELHAEADSELVLVEVRLSSG
jgi:redox-sensitive bicupin YhaK (pirin superfamily)